MSGSDPLDQLCRLEFQISLAEKGLVRLRNMLEERKRRDAFGLTNTEEKIRLLDDFAGRVSALEGKIQEYEKIFS